MDVRYLADIIKQTEFSMAPYRTGNLRQNGIESINQIMEDEAHFTINRLGYAPYGIILNEAPTISHKVKVNGTEVSVSYNNRHYKWHDNAFAAGVQAVAAAIGGEVL